ncbi:MAG: hypothetical protein QOC80_1542, partial [Frankiaceae bacterium]|nr:hypothetical protein [Frankiaceae bacterium]
DGQVDAVLKSVRASKPDTATETTSVDALLSSLTS